MGDLDIKGGTQDEADVAERAFAEVEHRKSCNDEKHRVAHPLEVGFSKERGHGALGHSSALDYEKRVITAFVATTVVGVIIVVVVNKSSFSAAWTRRIWPLTRPPSLPLSLSRYAWSVGCKLVFTGTAEILLVTIRIFAIAIKVLRVIAFRATQVYSFCHENLSFFGSKWVL